LFCTQVHMILNATFQIIGCIRVRRAHVSICGIEHVGVLYIIMHNVSY
jgi:hypothetical protein